MNGEMRRRGSFLQYGQASNLLKHVIKMIAAFSSCVSKHLLKHSEQRLGSMLIAA